MPTSKKQQRLKSAKAAANGINFQFDQSEVISVSNNLQSGLLPLSQGEQSLRSEYLSAFSHLENENPYSVSCKGKLNPYTGQPIKSKRDYDEYLRQHALRLAYEKLFSDSQYGALYSAAKVNFDRQLSLLNSENSRLAVSNRAQNDVIRQLETEKKVISDKLHRWSAATIVLVIVLVFGVFKLLPDARRSSYESGKSDGFAAGQEDGYNTGYASGENEGYSVGYASGKNEGYSKGYSSGKNEGYNSGYSSGRLAGYEAGKSDSYYNGYWSNVANSNAPRSSANQNNYSTTTSNTVYVSNKGKIHKYPNCSGMKYYTEMTYSDAVAAGYDFCSKCW